MPSVRFKGFSEAYLFLCTVERLGGFVQGTTSGEEAIAASALRRAAETLFRMGVY